MRIVEFVVVLVTLIALFGWLLGRPHTLAAGAARRSGAGDGADAAWMSSDPGVPSTQGGFESAAADDRCDSPAADVDSSGACGDADCGGGDGGCSD